MKIRTLVVDDHPVILAGIVCVLRSSSDMELVGEAADSSQAVDVLSSVPVDVLVTDFSMPQGRYGDGVAWLNFLRRRFPSLHIVVMTGIESGMVIASIQAAGVISIIGKGDSELNLAASIRAANRSEAFLSPSIQKLLDTDSSEVEGHEWSSLSKRECEVFRMFAEGMSIAQIAERVGRSKKTVSSQKQAALRKLNLRGDADVFKYALEQGVVSASQVARDRS